MLVAFVAVSGFQLFCQLVDESSAVAAALTSSWRSHGSDSGPICSLGFGVWGTDAYNSHF